MKGVIGHNIKVLSGFAFDSELFGHSGDIPLVRIRDVKRGYSDTYYTGKYDERYLIQNGDILIGMDGEFNIARWKGGRALLNQRVCKITTDESFLDSQYLFYALPLELKKIEDSTPFVTVKHLSVKQITAIEIPLPPLPIQRHIARVLDQADQLRKQAQQMETELNQLAQAVFLEMFGDTEKNPKGWDKVTIGDLVNEAKYGSGEKASESEGAYPILRMNNITYSGEWDFRSLKYIDLAEKEKDKYLVRKGDILFNRTNSKELVGKTAVYRLDKEMAYAGYLIRMRCNDLANPEYISAYLNSAHGKKTLTNMCKSIIGMANINAQELQGIQILKPPKSLQDEYANKIEKIRLMVEKNHRKSQELDTLFHSLVQKAFKGELIPTTMEHAA